jgi:hypothetical protein
MTKGWAFAIQVYWSGHEKPATNYLFAIHRRVVRRLRVVGLAEYLEFD